MEYNFKNIEDKWQKKWAKNLDLKTDYKKSKNKKYVLTMFSYPSGDKLHIGHWYNYGPVDTFARYLKMNGYNVFQPQGFDSFGLPAENYAIKHGIHPSKSTSNNIITMKKQLKSIGAMYNWDKEVITSEPDYYRWTQWLFLKLYNNKLAYQKVATVNWDPIDQTVLANEQVLTDGTSERSGAQVIQKPLKQWFFKITDYAEELLKFDNVQWPNKTMRMQKNWIGKSVGARISFKLENDDATIDVFTTRPDTLFGATYIVLAPEHPIIKNIKNNEIQDYCKKAQSKSELQRSDLDKSKTGIFTELYAINPANNKRIPIWTADYVLMGYGTGAIMAVPAHDQRDYEFADKYEINKIEVISSKETVNGQAYSGDGRLINSDFLNNLNIKEAKEKICNWLIEKNKGMPTINYKLKDWLISRQRYWGAPIPIVYDPEGKAHPIPEEHLPWLLPDDAEYKPKGTSPLGTSKELFTRTEKIFGKGWTPEIDTMDTFVCSSWYYLRYIDANNSDMPFDFNNAPWLPVDYYIGGAEHATMHLLYARFITKVLRDMGLLDIDEPFTNLYHQGTITKDGAKMSKSKGNTVSPDSFVENYGSDTFRCYLMFMGPFDEGGDWNDKGIKGIYRFLNRSWNISNRINKFKLSSDDEYILNSTIKNVSENLENMKFNTALSRLMEFVNHFYDRGLTAEMRDIFIKLLAPFSPHLCEEIWSSENENSVFLSNWPSFDSTKLQKANITIAIQVNGKLRGTINIDKNTSKDEILNLSKENINVTSHIENKLIIKEIYVPGKLVNIVAK